MVHGRTQLRRTSHHVITCRRRRNSSFRHHWCQASISGCHQSSLLRSAVPATGVHAGHPTRRSRTSTSPHRADIQAIDQKNVQHTGLGYVCTARTVIPHPPNQPQCSRGPKVHRSRMNDVRGLCFCLPMYKCHHAAACLPCGRLGPPRLLEHLRCLAGPVPSHPHANTTCGASSTRAPCSPPRPWHSTPPPPYTHPHYFFPTAARPSRPVPLTGRPCPSPCCTTRPPAPSPARWPGS